MSINPLPPCPYRRSREGMLICTVAHGEHDVVGPGACLKCPVPRALSEVNCVHLNMAADVNYHGPVRPRASCEVAGISGLDDIQAIKQTCSTCDRRFPIHLDLSEETPVRLLGFPPAGKAVVDRELRQAVLRVLYAFHARHPERFGRFDVTPEFLAESLGVDVQDVVRVVLPMEEEGEVKTLGVPGEPHFRYVALTAKGVHAIDDEPLFERNAGPSLEIGELRNEGGNVAIAAGNARVHQTVQVSADAEALLAKLEELLGPGLGNAEISNLLHEVRDALARSDKDRARGRLEQLLRSGKVVLQAAPFLEELIRLLNS